MKNDSVSQNSAALSVGAHTFAVPPQFLHLFAIPWTAILICVVIAETCAAQTASDFGALLLLGSALLFGLPHGAADLCAFKRGCGVERLSIWRVSLFLLFYVAAAFLMFFVWRENAGFALLCFLALALWHFGSADAALLKGIRNPFKAFVAVGRGLLVVFAPLTFYASESREVLQSLSALGGTSTSLNVADYLLTSAPTFLVVGIALQILGLSTIFENTNDDRRFGLFFALETIFLLILFSKVPPLLSAACYFILVHSWRHIFKLENDRDRSSPSLADLWRVVKTFHRRAMPLTLISLFGLIFLLAVFPTLTKELRQWTNAYLVLLSMLTLPHTIVIGLFESRVAE